MPPQPRETAPTNPGERPAQELHEISQQLAALVASHDRIETLLRIMADPILVSSLHKYFKNSGQVRAYELSDGIRSTRQIAKMVGVDQKTISTWWRNWKDNYRIVEKAGKRGQFRKRYTFVELLGLASGASAPKGPDQVPSPDGATHAEEISTQSELPGL